MKRAPFVLVSSILAFWLARPDAVMAQNNSINGYGSWVGGGYFNQASSTYAVVGAGGSNSALTNYASILGGGQNSNKGYYGTIGGGFQNSNSGSYADILGGYANRAGGSNQIIAYSDNLKNSAAVQAEGVDFPTNVFVLIAKVGLAKNIPTNSGAISVVGGGLSNNAAAAFATIGGGANNSTLGEFPTIGGGANNFATGIFATIAGGLANKNNGACASIGGGFNNRAINFYSTVAGGAQNMANDSWSTVGGGFNNLANDECTTVAGGCGNYASDSFSTVGGGYQNIATGDISTIAGGANNLTYGTNAAIGGGGRNRASGVYSTIPGGFGNSTDLTADYSFAAGYGASATNVGSFVWSSRFPTTSSAPYDFTVSAPGGVRFITSTSSNAFYGAFLSPNATAWSILSDRNSKENFRSIDVKSILHKLEQMPVTEWNYKHDPSRIYIGPTAQDFKRAFGLGEDDKSINTLDATGVIFAAIKGLGEELNQQDKQISDLRSQINDMAQSMAIRDAKINALERKLEKLDERLNMLSPTH
jgi:Chaperone of endosialidase